MKFYGYVPGMCLEEDVAPPTKFANIRSKYRKVARRNAKRAKRMADKRHLRISPWINI